MPPYLDHAATTPLRPEALEAMLPFLRDHFGNPSGQHAAARAAKTAIEESREVIASGLGVRPGEVVFTGTGTEADNLAVKGAARAARDRGVGDGVVTTAIEHHAVLHSVDRLEREGFRVSRVGVDRGGIVDLDALATALDERTVIVSVMLANNEVGTIQPIDRVAALMAERAPRAVLHTDAVQAAPWMELTEACRPAHLIAISAHKFGGPKGVGALAVRQGTRLQPIVDGGGQERDLRSGTHNVAGIVGMAAAWAATNAAQTAAVARVAGLRDRLAAGLDEAVPDLRHNGDLTRKVANNCHVTVPGVEAEALLLLLDRDGVEAAAGSSCASGAANPSHVLAAMGIPAADARSSLRLSLGWCSTEADVDDALAILTAAVTQLRDRAGGRLSRQPAHPA